MGPLWRGVQVDPMRVVLVVLCVGTVGFLLRVLLALALEWVHWRSGDRKMDPSLYNPPETRESMLVLEAEPPRRAAGRVSLRA